MYLFLGLLNLYYILIEINVIKIKLDDVINLGEGEKA